MFKKFRDKRMTKKKLELIDEQSSPLFRIMSVYNVAERTRRSFENNICAFHIGRGLILSVAHNLRLESGILRSIDETIYQRDILPHLNPTQTALFNRCYSLDGTTNKRYLGNINNTDVQQLIDLLKQANFDTRWLTLVQKNICRPYLIVQFRNNQFYNNATLTGYFNSDTFFQEPSLNRYTFLLALELVSAYYNEDFALYRIIDTNKDIINRLPSIAIDYAILNDNEQNLYCIQSSPGAFLGRLLNSARIEGFLDHFNILPDRIGGDYISEGMRYLIKGYFRFGSSGAPYVVYDTVNRIFKVNAIQSEASPIQLSINNNREGNYQYVSAIAPPLKIIQEKLQPYLRE